MTYDVNYTLKLYRVTNDTKIIDSEYIKYVRRTRVYVHTVDQVITQLDTK
jgi:hypothetical protein